MIRWMLQAIEAEGADIAVCNYKTGRSKQERSTKGKQRTISCDGARAASMVLRGHPSGLMVWNKLYRRSLLPYLTFSEGHVYEGKAPLLNAMLHSGRVVFLPDALYYYTKRTDSITNSITLANEMDRVRSAQDSTAIISDSAPELMPDMQHLAAKMNALTWMRLQFCQGKAADDYAAEVRKYVREQRSDVRKSDLVGYVAIWMTVYTPGLCRLVFRHLKR